MTITSERAAEQLSPNSGEGLVEEARLSTRRRRLRFVLAVLIVVVAATAIWIGSGGGIRPSAASRVGTSSAPDGSPTGSSNGTAPAILDGQSIVRTMAFGPNTMWVFTQNETTLSGGSQDIELTSNGGETWSKVTPPGLSVEGGDRWMGNFIALSPMRAWIVSGRLDTGPQIIETTHDAGRTWTKVGLMPSNGCELQFVNVHDGTCTFLDGAAGSMIIKILRTSDGGARWHQVFANTPNTTSATQGSIPFGCDKNIDFTSAQKGFALFYCAGGSGAFVEETMNGGSTWTEHAVSPPSSIPVGGGGFSGPPVFRGAHGALPYAIGRDSEVYVTDNGGQSFHPVYPPGKPRQWMEDIVSPSMWRLYYGKEILGTNNAGRTWFTVRSDTVLQTTSYSTSTPPGGLVQFSTARDGWLTENLYDANSQLLRTTDGGRRWSNVAVPGNKKA